MPNMLRMFLDLPSTIKRPHFKNPYMSIYKGPKGETAICLAGTHIVMVSSKVSLSSHISLQAFAAHSVLKTKAGHDRFQAELPQH